MSKGTVNKLRLFAIVALCAAIAYGLYHYYDHKIHNNELTLHGNVDIRQVDLGFRVSGRLESMQFEEGDAVKQGELLAKLDKVPYVQALAKSQGDVNALEANLKKLLSGNRPQEIQEARSQLKEKEVAYHNAKKTLDRQAELVKKNWTSKQAFDDATAKAKETYAQLKTAEEALKLSEEGFRSEDIAQAKAQLEASNAQLENAKTNLGDTELYAPSNGIILTRIKEPGSILQAGTPVYTLSLTYPIWVRAYVSEIELGLIKPGMQALVYTDAHPDKPFKGKIGFISPQAEFTPKNVETKELRTDLVYRLRITVDDPEGALRQGMPVTVNIKLNAQNEPRRH